jgi:hypothetical protein
MATVAKILDAVQNNLKLSGDVLVSINTTLTIANGIGEKVAEAIQRALDGDISGLSQALTDLSSSNTTLTEAVTTLGKVKDVIVQSIPSLESPENPTDPSEPIEPITPIDEDVLPGGELPIEILPTSDDIGLPGSESITIE